MINLNAPGVGKQPVSVTRKMSASLPGLRDLARRKGLKIHHLGAGYPHPEVTDPRGFIDHERAYFNALAAAEGLNDPGIVPEHLRESFSYGDTLGPVSTRRIFAEIYGADWQRSLDPDRLVPTVGASGGINLICSLFERAGTLVAYLTDAPTYAGFLARTSLCQHATIFSVEMDDEGPDVTQLRAQIHTARAAGYFVPFYYTIPDGHNPAGFSFSQARRDAVVALAREEGILIVEDAPYLYINYAPAERRPRPFLSLAPEQTVHLFTGSKIGFPGPRVAFLYSEANLAIAGGEIVSLTELALTEASSDILFQNPGALRGFEALLHERIGERFQPRPSLWPVAQEKLTVYRENREIMLSGLQRDLDEYPERFAWTHPAAGFFSVFTFKPAAGIGTGVRTDDAFIARMVSEYGLVVIPMYDFYPPDAKVRNPNAGYDQLRLSFCFTESVGDARRTDLQQSIEVFCKAAKAEAGIS